MLQRKEAHYTWQHLGSHRIHEEPSSAPEHKDRDSKFHPNFWQPSVDIKRGRIHHPVPRCLPTQLHCHLHAKHSLSLQSFFYISSILSEQCAINRTILNRRVHKEASFHLHEPLLCTYSFIAKDRWMGWAWHRIRSQILRFAICNKRHSCLAIQPLNLSQDLLSKHFLYSSRWDKAQDDILVWIKLQAKSFSYWKDVSGKHETFTDKYTKRVPKYRSFAAKYEEDSTAELSYKSSPIRLINLFVVQFWFMYDVI